MEITGELFIDVPTFRRIAKLEFARANVLTTASATTFIVSVSASMWSLLYDLPALSGAALAIGFVLILLVPGSEVRALTRRYRREGPIVWRYQIDEHGFRVTGRRSVEGGWAHYTKVVETADLWLVRPPFGAHGVALPKAAFSEPDRRAVAALLRRKRPATVIS